MPLKIRIVKMLISWLWNHYQYLLREQVIPEKYHIHKNPPKKDEKGGMKPAPVGE